MEMSKKFVVGFSSKSLYKTNPKNLNLHKNFQGNDTYNLNIKFCFITKKIYFHSL